LVTVPLETLQTGVGTATISGVDEPICAGTARRLAADAEIIPVVLGSNSEVLDLGRTARLFTSAQRRALAARDGGCIWPGCTMPPAWCEVAHLLAWQLGGETDLENGALMCPHHHRRFDHDGWALRREHGTPYLIPPTWLDPQQTPRRAGRFELVA
nr:HNH endonuclease [Actinomycetota bacterium]